MSTKIEKSLTCISSYIGEYNLDELVDLNINNLTSFLVVNLGECHISLAIYYTTCYYSTETLVYICDPTGALSAGLPPQLTDFLYRSLTDTHVHITNQLSTSCTDFIILFVHYMSKNHSYCKFLSLYTENYVLNDCITKHMLNFL